MSARPDMGPRRSASSVWTLLGVAPQGARLHAALHDGFPAEVFGRLSEMTGLGREALRHTLHFAPSTLQRRLSAGRFNLDESDRLFRVIKLLDEAQRLFEGDLDAARRWMNHPVKALGGRRPMELMATSAEATEVYNLIGRLEHGVFS